MYYSEEVIEEVRSRNDVVDIISSYVSLKKKGSSYFGLCPFHSEKSPSFSVSREKQMFYCFGCGKGGNVFTFLMEYENFTYQEAIEYLAERANVDLPKKELSPQEKAEADYRGILREMNTNAANYFYRLLFHEHGKKGYEYLRKRKISDETIKKFGLGYSDIYRDDLYRFLRSKGYSDEQLKNSGLVEIYEQGGQDKFWNRVMFPIVDMNGKVIGFGGRVMGDGEPKYLNSKETALFQKKRNLYGLQFARKSKRQGMIICEGYMDVISMHQAGFDNAVASLGTAFTEQQAQLIKRYTNRVYLAYDSDGAGVKAALRAIEICQNVDLSIRVITMEPYKDPDEFIKNLGKEEYELRIERAISGFMFKVKNLSKNYDQNDPESKTQFQREVAKLLAEIQEKMERTNYIEAVSNEYFIDKELLTEYVNNYGNGLSRQKEFKQIEEKVNRERSQTKQITEEKKKETGQNLLTWMIQDKKIFEEAKLIVQPEDFLDDLMRKVATMVYDQYENNDLVNTARIINQFSNIEEQSQVAAMFSKGANLDENEDAKKAFSQVVKKIKLQSIDYQLEHIDDMDKFIELIKQKEALKS